VECSFGEVGLGGFGFHIWDGVIRECRVEMSNVLDMQGSGGIRGIRLCSDKRRLSRLPLVDSGFVRISPWEGCKPGLDVSLWSVGLNWCHACLFTHILKVGCMFFWDRIGLGLFGFWVSRIFGKGLGSVWHDSAIFSLGWGYVRISSTGFWLCNIIYIIDKGFSMFGIVYGLSGYIASENCNEYDQLWFDYFVQRCIKV
ncbi:hypothetical protein Tco_0663422, partial [Tanacetum coccineum]